MLDLTINLGNLLSIIVFVGGGIIFVTRVQGKVDALAIQVLSMEEEMKKLVEVLIQQGRHEERLAAMDQRMMAQGSRLDALLERVNRYINGEERRIS